MQKQSRTAHVQLSINDRPFTEWDNYIVHTQFGPPLMQHRAYFCPICGSIWAREFISSHPEKHWAIEPRFCVPHGDGSLLTKFQRGFSEYYLTALPKPLLAREFLLMYDEIIGD